MHRIPNNGHPYSSLLRDKILQGKSPGEYLQSLGTPLNVLLSLLVLPGLYMLYLRFTEGLGAVTGGLDDQPWGLFLSWGLFSGVPLSATGFLMGTAVYLFGMKEYHPIARNAILVGFLGYSFAVIFLLVDLGRPWRLPYPMVYSFGPASVLFLVAWHVALYLTVQFLEFSPAIWEWLNLKVIRGWALSITIGVTIFGVILSTLHQSALGAMYLLAPGKLHPLWYSPYIPVLFFVSAIAAGLSMVIFVSWITKACFKAYADGPYLASVDRVTPGLGKAVSLALFTYLGLKVVAVAHENSWALLTTPYGLLLVVEVLGFVLLPSILLAYAAGRRRIGLIRFGAVLTMVGVVFNRLNVSLIALNWQLPHRELLNLRELAIVVSIVTIEVIVYRWIITRMPVLREPAEHEMEDLEPLRVEDFDPVRR
ncbi:MAG: polysulfide reductase NrfD [Chloroflexi bacterium]|nr:polysulfide reductase NrfD [Chloroflexota bacterium]